VNQQQYDLLEASAENTEAVAKLISWSENYDFPTPASLFLDLIGYSEEEFGDRLCREDLPNLGYLELDMLADALKQYADTPMAVYDFVAAWDRAGSDDN
jgi:hypothetical protein